MAVVFGTIANGQSVSSAFTLQSTDRALLVAVSSHAVLQWFASFQITPGAAFVRYLDPWTTNSNGAFMVAAGGGVGLVDYRPAPTMRIETSAGVSATTSFCLIEAARG
jgi:hypothetical protein